MISKVYLKKQIKMTFEYVTVVVERVPVAGLEMFSKTKYITMKMN